MDKYQVQAIFFMLFGVLALALMLLVLSVGRRHSVNLWLAAHHFIEGTVWSGVVFGARRWIESTNLIGLSEAQALQNELRWHIRMEPSKARNAGVTEAFGRDLGCRAKRPCELRKAS